jgi:hypothetical protein
VIKRAGHKHVRNIIKRTLTENPEEAAHIEDDFGKYRTAELNGIDRDLTRQRTILPEAD